ncbi:early nodulin-like protein 1 [Rosa sericea]
MRVNVVILVLVIALTVVMLRRTEAERYRVGGDLGWTIPPGGAATYASWASKHTFKADKDTLVFDFKAGENDLTIVTKENFDTCNTKDPLYQFKSPGVLVGASMSGTFYFTCSFAGHCAKGQKVAIHFAPSLTRAHSAAPSPSPSASDEAVATEQLKIRMMA